VCVLNLIPNICMNNLSECVDRSMCVFVNMWKRVCICMCMCVCMCVRVSVDKCKKEQERKEERERICACRDFYV